MGKRNLYIDHEEYKMKIKLSASTNMLLLQDMDRFGFIKSNEEVNTNYFINYILPIIYQYREEQNQKLKKKLLDKSLVQSSIDEFIEEMNNFYFEDDISYHNEVINLRISNKNMELFQRIFNESAKKKSTFIRSLINQYSSLKLDMREFLCFNNEYHLIEEAINKYVIQADINDGEFQFLPIGIETCSINSEIYVFGLYIEKKEMFIKAFRLCEISNIKKTEQSFDFKLTEAMKNNIDEFIFGLEYLNDNCKKLGGI